MQLSFMYKRIQNMHPHGLPFWDSPGLRCRMFKHHWTEPRHRHHNHTFAQEPCLYLNRHTTKLVDRTFFGPSYSKSYVPTEIQHHYTKQRIIQTYAETTKLPVFLKILCFINFTTPKSSTTGVASSFNFKLISHPFFGIFWLWLKFAGAKNQREPHFDVGHQLGIDVVPGLGPSFTVHQSAEGPPQGLNGSGRTCHP